MTQPGEQEVEGGTLYSAHIVDGGDDSTRRLSLRQPQLFSLSHWKLARARLRVFADHVSQATSLCAELASPLKP